MIKKENGFKHNFSNAIGRWAGVGPYYAMFPLTFAFDVVDKYTSQGESVLDPFAGRGSSVYAAAVSERSGVAIEINPVGWIYGRAKLNTSSKRWVKRRLNKVRQHAPDYEHEADELPEFFDYCYTPQIQRFLLAARSELNWRHNKSDATLMAIILVYLHGKRDRALSNQMRQAKAMSPDYSVRWWKEREMEPPQKNPYDFMEKRIEWRYKNGCPPSQNSRMLLGNSENIIVDIQKEVENGKRDTFSLLFTSPPYYGVTNYYYDQWLRLWMLGYPPYPKSPGEKYKRKFESKDNYEKLLWRVFNRSARVMSEDSIIYVRTDAREYTFRTTREILSRCFPEKNEKIKDRPVLGNTQTSLYGNKSQKPGEIDIVMT